MNHSKSSRKWRIAVALSIVAGVLVGCSTGSPESPADPSANSDDLTLGFVFNTATDPNQQSMLAGIKKAAEAEGWTVKEADPNGDASKANNLITAFVSQGVDVVVTTVFPPSALRQGIASAEAANIPVVATYAYGEEPGVAAVVTATAAKEETERLIEDLGGEGSVLAFTFQVGQPCVEAEKVFDQLIAEHPEITVQKQEVQAPGWEQGGLQAASAWLKSHPEGSENLAIWGCWDGPSLGAISALKQEGRTDVFVYGQYGEAGALAAVQEGAQTATYWFDNDIAGEETVKTIKEIISAGDDWQPTQIFLEPIEVDSDSIEQFLAEHPSAAGN